ncbi:MAG TPA: helix-turn-helix domain-containing protein [Actinospica sp.]|jgi:AcrR family transcriptional regulator|nr:helix-turn-helix domain-containing protein [Actinospica sp.]
MEPKLAGADGSLDRRVRRSRGALMRAAVEVVSERGTTDVSVSDIARAADVTRRVLYEHFGDRDTLLLEAGLDLVRRELLPRLADSDLADDADGTRERTLAVARHFAEHRGYFRALMTGSCAFALDRGLADLLLPFNREGFERMYGHRLDKQGIDDLTVFVTGGGSAIFTAWVVDGPEPLDPESFTDRLLRALALLLPLTHVAESPARSES